ncbi:liprin-alpha-1-like isoform X1 [Ovis aries]|uniref:liprin-alpha-1-like isoform X1 n=1 Tax=Ovis aries TaxID=9940 RepID=UPI001C2E3178|nr:liprin-alpha-1-like isoform X1 [Ovis aries]
MRIQEQLDKINEEIWFIQKDKENTDQRAEGIESRVGSGSFSNLRRFESSSSLNLDPASSHAGSFPPSRGRSMPERRQPSPEPEEDKLGFMTLLPAIQEEVEDDTIKCETSSSTSLRSFHLDRLTGSLHIASDEDIRDADNATGSQDGPGGNPSNSNSSQDSLQKAPKKKGITSSIGRWFGRKEKGRPGHTSKEALGPGGCFTVQREEGLCVCPFCVSPAVPMRLLSLTLSVLLVKVEEASVFSRV